MRCGFGFGFLRVFLAADGITAPERQFRAVTAALDDQELPVRMQAALTLTEMVVLYDSGASYLHLGTR